MIQHITTKAHLLFVQLEPNATDITLQTNKETKNFEGSLFYMADTFSEPKKRALWAKYLPNPIFAESWSLLGKLEDIKAEQAKQVIGDKIENEFSKEVAIKITQYLGMDQILNMDELNLFWWIIDLNTTDTDNWVVLYCPAPQTTLTEREQTLLLQRISMEPDVYFDTTYIIDKYDL